MADFGLNKTNETVGSQISLLNLKKIPISALLSLVFDYISHHPFPAGTMLPWNAWGGSPTHLEGTSSIKTDPHEEKIDRHPHSLLFLPRVILWA